MRIIRLTLSYLQKYITIPYKQDDKDFKRVKKYSYCNSISSFGEFFCSDAGKVFYLSLSGILEDEVNKDKYMDSNFFILRARRFDTDSCIVIKCNDRN